MPCNDENLSLFPTQEEILKIVQEFGVETCTMRMIRTQLTKINPQYDSQWENEEWKDELEQMVIEAADLVQSSQSSILSPCSQEDLSSQLALIVERPKRASSKGALKKATKKKSNSRFASSSSTSTKVNPFNEPMGLSPVLSEFLGGKSECSRPQTVKHIWNYIKEHQLQDPKDKKYILCDARMQKLFKVPRVHMFTMNRLLSSHLYPKE